MTEDIRKLADEVLAKCARLGDFMCSSAEENRIKGWIVGNAPKLAHALKDALERETNLRMECQFLNHEGKKARDRVRELEEVLEKLLAEYEKEKEEYGFPFNFALREAHRQAHLAMLPTEGEEE